MGDVEWSFAESRFEMRYNIAMQLKCSVYSQHRSSLGEWGAHNPQVLGSKPRGAMTGCVVMQLCGGRERLYHISWYVCGVLPRVGGAYVLRHGWVRRGWCRLLNCVTYSSARRRGTHVGELSSTHMGDVEWSFAESRFEMRYNIAMRPKCSAHSQHRSSVGEWGAHNPQVRGSKPRGAMTGCVVMQLCGGRECLYHISWYVCGVLPRVGGAYVLRHGWV